MVSVGGRARARVRFREGVDQVIREDPASRGTEASAGVGVRVRVWVKVRVRARGARPKG